MRTWGAILAAVAVIAGAASGRTAAASAGACALDTADRERTDSLDCLGCHGNGKDANGRFLMRSGGFGHVVDVEYEAIRARAGQRLAAASELPREVRLVNGRIACTTCHDGRGGHEHKLATAKQTQLCLACHRL
jgi:predicted CXXCH cytochrome family protein